MTSNGAALVILSAGNGANGADSLLRHVFPTDQATFHYGFHQTSTMSNPETVS